MLSINKHTTASNPTIRILRAAQIHSSSWLLQYQYRTHYTTPYHISCYPSCSLHQVNPLLVSHLIHLSPAPIQLLPFPCADFQSKRPEKARRRFRMASSNSTYDAQASTNYKEAFALFDKRGTQRVSLESLGDLLRACGQNPTLAEIKELEKNVGSDCESFLKSNLTLFFPTSHVGLDST